MTERPAVAVRERDERTHQGLREWLDLVDRMGQLKVVEGADADLEIGTITELNARNRQGPALLFDRIPSYEPGYRLVTGTLLNADRLALAFGLPTGLSNQGLVEALKGKPRLWETRAADFPPQMVATGPVFEETERGDAVDVSRFPAPRWHELDGGRYLGAGASIVTRDPDTGLVNVGTYRVQFHDKRTVGLMISPGKHGRLHMERWHARGEAMPVAIVIGQDMALFSMSAQEVPLGICEYNYVGAIKGRPLELVEGPVTGLPFPPDAEVVLEGFVPAGETRPEGPYGEWSGYYASGERPQPYVVVEAVHHRRNPIVLSSPPGKSPYDHSYLCAVMRSAMLKDALERAGVPDVRGVWRPEAGGTRLLVVVSIKQRYAGHARQAGFVAAQVREGAYAGRYIVVVDEDVDPSNIDDVLWAICTRSDPVSDIDFIRRAWSTALDPMVRPGTTPFNSRAIIDACRPWEWLSEFPAVSESSPELVARVREKWQGVLEL